tara:strand:+ start:2143 stop:2412 length:270 start_codon:yes stop_codon:yes gene_type:complete
MVVSYKNKFNKKYKFKKDTSHSLGEIANLTGYKLSNIKKIFQKGKGAYYSNPSSVRPQVTSASQWAYARVYASVSKGSKSSKIDEKLLK